MLNIDMPPQVRAFIMSFARFEYALKRAGYVHTRGASQDAQVNWSAFENAHHEAFRNLLAQPNNRLQTGIKSFDAEPPRKLILHRTDGTRELRWKAARTNGQLLNRYLTYVRRVRNNLLHGEKPQTLVGDSSRGLELVQSALAVLEACLALNPTVERYFHEYGPPIPRLDDQPDQ
jgi:hypothetical protein